MNWPLVTPSFSGLLLLFISFGGSQYPLLVRRPLPGLCSDTLCLGVLKRICSQGNLFQSQYYDACISKKASFFSGVRRRNLRFSILIIVSPKLSTFVFMCSHFRVRSILESVFLKPIYLLFVTDFHQMNPEAKAAVNLHRKMTCGMLFMESESYIQVE